MEDLWPHDLENIVPPTAPVAILREQANMLSKKMKNLIEGLVLGDKMSAAEFEYSFYITAPGLGNYRYQVFSLTHDIKMYPSFIFLDRDIQEEIVGQAQPRTLKMDSEEDLKEMLKKIFASRKVQQVIGALIAQLRAEPQET